jgi:ABC-2 type transport system ATP-binding protein
VHDVRTEDGRVHFSVDGAQLDAAVRHLSEHGVRSLTSHPPTLEELMLRHYGVEANGAGAGSRGSSSSTGSDGAR